MRLRVRVDIESFTLLFFVQKRDEQKGKKGKEGSTYEKFQP